MSEQREFYMEALDQWTQTSIINPVTSAMLDAHENTWAEVVQDVKRAVRTKVLESYHNGQAASPKVGKGGHHGR